MFCEPWPHKASTGRTPNNTSHTLTPRLLSNHLNQQTHCVGVMLLFYTRNLRNIYILSQYITTCSPTINLLVAWRNELFKPLIIDVILKRFDLVLDCYTPSAINRYANIPLHFNNTTSLSRQQLQTIFQYTSKRPCVWWVHMNENRYWTHLLTAMRSSFTTIKGVPMSGISQI